MRIIETTSIYCRSTTSINAAKGETMKNEPTKIHHVIDIEKRLGVDNLGEFINITSF